VFKGHALPVRTKVASAVALIVALMSVGLFAVPASAAPAAPTPIPSNKCEGSVTICFYSAQGYGGTEYAFSVATNDTGCKNFEVLGGSNTATSIINLSYGAFYVYDSSSCTTLLGTVYARTANDNIGPANNDKISSFRRTAPV